LRTPRPKPPTTLPRVEVTGSQLRRPVTESGLPLQVIGRSEIEPSGATSLAELLQRLPMVQGQQASTESVGNDGNGITTVSLHNLGAKYTLVLPRSWATGPRRSTVRTRSAAWST
jgi:iron complex outermembrane recepter protein